MTPAGSRDNSRPSELAQRRLRIVELEANESGLGIDYPGSTV
jgi:hypothetical protein